MLGDKPQSARQFYNHNLINIRTVYGKILYSMSLEHSKMTTGRELNQECNLYSDKMLQPRLVTNKIGPAPNRRCINFLFGDIPHLSPKFMPRLLGITNLCDHTILIFIDCQP